MSLKVKTGWMKARNSSGEMEDIDLLLGAGGNGNAEVTAGSIKSALGYTPADSAEVSSLKEDLNDYDERISALENGGGHGGGSLTPQLKTAFKNYFTHVAGVFDDGNGDSYIDAILDALGELVAPTGIRLSANTLSFTTLESKTLRAYIEPSDATGVVTWESSNNAVCTVNNGIVTATGNGNATITARVGSVSATCSVSVAVAKTVYTITTNLTGCTASNSKTTAEEGSQYNNVLTPNDGFAWKSASVSMGGTDVTSTAYNNGNVNILNVTGNIVITAVAEEVSTVLFDLSEPLVCDGSKYVDTGIVVCGSGNLYSKNMTMLIDVTVDPQKCFDEVGSANPTTAPLFDIANSGRFKLMPIYTTAVCRLFYCNAGNGIDIATGNGYQKWITDRVRIAITRTSGDNKVRLVGKGDNAGNLIEYSITGAYGNWGANIPYSLLVNGYYDADSNGNKVVSDFRGTVHRFTIMEEILSDDAIMAFVNGGES